MNNMNIAFGTNVYIKNDDKLNYVNTDDYSIKSLGKTNKKDLIADICDEGFGYKRQVNAIGVDRTQICNKYTSEQLMIVNKPIKDVVDIFKSAQEGDTLNFQA